MKKPKDKDNAEILDALGCISENIREAFTSAAEDLTDTSVFHPKHKLGVPFALVFLGTAIKELAAALRETKKRKGCLTRYEREKGRSSGRD